MKKTTPFILGLSILMSSSSLIANEDDRFFGVKRYADEKESAGKDSDKKGEAFVKMKSIPKGEVAVIGLKDLYAQEAEDHFKKTIKNGDHTEVKMHEFISDAIDSQNSLGVFSIGKPCGLYKYEGRHLSLEKLTK